MHHVLSLGGWIIIAGTGLLFLLTALPVQIRFIYEGSGRSHKTLLRLGVFNGRLSVNANFSPPQDEGKKLRPKIIRKKGAGLYRPLLGNSGVKFLVQWRRLCKTIIKIKSSVLVIRELLKRCVCTRLLWETGFGFNDYAATGLAAGLFWAGKGLVIGLISRYLRIDPAGMRIVVIPQFGSTCYASTLDCILKTSLGYIIIVVIKLSAIRLFQISGIFIRRKRYA